MNENFKDYHDYVFRDGRLVGEFEAMYRNSEGTPWHQDEQENWVDVRLTGEMLRDIAPYDEIHDLGCGLGHYLAILRSKVGAEECRGFGYDISETACAKAQKAWPDFQFFHFNLTLSGTRNPEPETRSGKDYLLYAARFGMFSPNSIR